MDTGAVPSERREAPIWRREPAFGGLTQSMLRQASQGVRRIEFLQSVSAHILEASDCDALEIRLSDRDFHYRWESDGRPDSSRFTMVDPPKSYSGTADTGVADPLERLCRLVLLKGLDSASENVTAYGSYFTGDAEDPAENRPGESDKSGTAGASYTSLAIIPFAVESESQGLLVLKSHQRHSFDSDRVEYFEAVSRYLGVAVANRRAQAALRERVKELTCLYGLALLTARADLSADDFLQSAVELLPPAWQYPELACAQITFDAHTYRTRRFGEALHTQAAPIVVDGRQRGAVDVRYFSSTPEFGHQVFLAEESHLIDAVASQLAMVLERRQTEQKRLHLEAQLRHADRLATIGQLAAGVAHELNEPLGNILGLAQLMTKDSELSTSGRGDVDKIVSASLHAREIIRSLMLFARQTPPQKVVSDLNELVEDSLSFVELRCAKAGITLVTQLAPDLPGMAVDPVQIRQVVVNLAVNAVQAMPGGGTLTVTTRPHGSYVVLSVKDTGTGMSEHVKKKLFMPFFTTKDSHEGTGLGLSVTHGIVTAHGGSISFESSLGAGSEFEVHLPVKSVEWEPEEDGLERP